MRTLQESILDDEHIVVGSIDNKALISKVFNDLYEAIYNKDTKSANNAIKILGLDMTKAEERDLVRQSRKIRPSIKGLIMLTRHFTWTKLREFRYLFQDPKAFVIEFGFGLNVNSGIGENRRFSFSYKISIDRFNNLSEDARKNIEIEHILTSSDYLKRIIARLTDLGFKRFIYDTDDKRIFEYSYTL